LSLQPPRAREYASRRSKPSRSILQPREHEEYVIWHWFVPFSNLQPLRIQGIHRNSFFCIFSIPSTPRTRKYHIRQTSIGDSRPQPAYAGCFMNFQIVKELPKSQEGMLYRNRSTGPTGISTTLKQEVNTINIDFNSEANLLQPHRAREIRLVST